MSDASTPFSDDDVRFMRLALQEAERAAELDEVPVGAVIVANGKVIARAHNLCERLRDFTAHAEMQAFTSASEFLGGKFLDKCTLYVTLEPCPMCAGAAYWTRIGRVVYGAKDDKRGHSKFDGDLTMSCTPKPQCEGGLLADEAAALLTSTSSGPSAKFPDIEPLPPTFAACSN